MFKACISLLFFPLILFCVDHQSLCGQVAAPGLNAEQRLELAKQFLKPFRKAAIANPAEREYFFTEYTAQYDPVWTARFLLRNPGPDDGVLRDNKALLELMQRPTEIPDDVLLELLKNSNKYAAFSYAARAVGCLPEDQKKLRQQIIDQTLASLDASAGALHTFGAKKRLAASSQNPDHIEQVQKQIADYYESGKADKQWQHVKDQQADEQTAFSGVRSALPWLRHDPGYKRRNQKKLMMFAPPEFRNGFQLNDPNHIDTDPVAFLRSEDLSDMEKLEKLGGVEPFEFGKQTHQQMSLAGVLGTVALYDLERALKWSESAPHARARIWAQLVIAPSLAKQDSEKAKQLVRGCYDQLLQLDASDTVEENYNFSPVRLAAAALPLVAAVDPDLMERCIEQTMKAAESQRGSRMHSGQDHLFQMIAAIAPYDMIRARQLFDQYADDVRLNSAAAFFRALLSTYPDQTWQEYQEMPESDQRGIDYRIYVRNEILPALLKQDAAEFWLQLNNSGLLGFDPRVVEP